MRKEFLRIVAERFFAETGGELRDYCFVFPNKRASLFFRRYLSQCSDRPFFSPSVTNINDFFTSLSSLRTMDKIHLQQRLFRVFKKVMPDFRESFDDFIYHADVVLNDFDDIDKYLVDADKLFTNIRDLKEIDSHYDYLSQKQRDAIASFWGVFIPYRDGRKERSFMQIWDSLLSIYKTFRSDLTASGNGYEGMIYRDVAESIQSADIDMLKRIEGYSHVVFVGLSAPNKCEKVLFDHLVLNGIADFYWDYYGDAIRDTENKSSLLMKDNVERYHSLYSMPEDGGLPQDIPHIEAVAVPSGVGQTKYVHRLLQDIARTDKSEMFSTAVLLPDEGLLFPLLNSLPEEISKVNVTMGYPLSNSGVATFVRALASLQEHRREKDGQVAFYHKDVVNLLSHPFIKGAMSVSGNSDAEDESHVPGTASDSIISRIVSENIIYVPCSVFSHPMLAEIFVPLPLQQDVPQTMSVYLKKVLDMVSAYVDKLDKEFVLGYRQCLNALQSLDIPMRKDTYFTLLGRITTGISIPFSGEPLAGLQIMGPLEIRSLDFENLIILSVNEDTFPSAGTAASLIPYNLRRGFDLPTYELQDAVGAYHFYRSICRARNVYLLYDSRGTGLRSGEESRYIKQLEYHHGYHVVHRNVSFGITDMTDSRAVDVFKSEEDILKLKSMTYSASTLQTYIECPMQFYFKKVLGLEEEKEVSESMDEASFGTLYHGVMKRLYEPYRGRPLDADELKKLSEDRPLIKRCLMDTFREDLKISTVGGHNRIAEAVVAKLSERTLVTDISRAPFTVKELEKTRYAHFRTAAGHDMKFKYVIDRLDTHSGTLYIVDYKTGASHFTFRSISSLFDSETYAEGKHIFQLMLYLLLLDSERLVPDIENTALSVYYTKKIFSEAPSFMFVTEKEFAEFSSHLSALMEEILNPDIPFSVCKDTGICEYCPYTAKCKK